MRITVLSLAVLSYMILFFREALRVRTGKIHGVLALIREGVVSRWLGITAIHVVIILAVMAQPHDGAYIGFIAHAAFTFLTLVVSLVSGAAIFIWERRLGAKSPFQGFNLCLLAWPVAILAIVICESLRRLGVFGDNH